MLPEELFVPYRSLEAAVPRVELHVHTDQTDGRSTIEEFLNAAAGKKLTALAFTEHVRRDSTWFGVFATRVRRAAAAYPGLRVLAGCEAKGLDWEGTLDLPADILPESDLVLGSVHRFPAPGGKLVEASTLPYAVAADLECALALALIDNDLVDVLAHPCGMVLRHFGRFPPELMEKIVRRAAEKNRVLEINLAYLDTAEKFEPFLALCRRYNPRVSLGSDAHHALEVGSCQAALRDRFRGSGCKGAVQK